MSSDTSAESGDQRPGSDAAETAEDLAAQVERLAEENRRLRGEYVRAKRATHRQTALGLFAVGALAVLGAVALPDSRPVLLALGGTGLFGGVLTYFLTPEQFVAAESSERVYAAFAATGEELAGELGLRGERAYVPARTDEPFVDVRLFVPHRTEYSVPDPEQLDSLFVVGDEFERGVAVPTTGGALYREFETGMTDAVADAPDALARQLADALVEGFELVESAVPDADPDGGRITVAVGESVYGPIDRFDHPVVSFFGTGVAVNLETPVTVEVRADDDRDGDLVTCEWDPDAAATSASD